MNHYSKDPRFKVTCQVEQDKKITEFAYTGEIPKELMDRFQALVGDGKAGVTVSSDFGVKKFGNGAGSMVVVSLTCDQSEGGVNGAAELAASASRFFVRKFHGEAESELRSMLIATGRTPEF